jgi:formylglycine-generating enzyme
VKRFAVVVLVGCASHAPESPDATPAPADAALQGAGTWADPKPIASLPYVDHADTTGAAAVVASYACKPAADESGGEIVYQLALAAPAYVRASLTDVAAGADVDVHIVDSPDTCLARGDVAALHQLVAGSYFIVVDSYQGKVGAYTLTVDTDTAVGDCLTDPIPECATYPTPDVDRVPVEPPGVGGCPAGMTAVGGAFCVDRWEAALVLDTPQGPRGFSPYAHPTTETVRAVSAPGVVPQAYIDELTAAQACARAGKRMCTDTEWLRACQGSSGTTYPYGNTREPGVCNDARSCHPAIQYFQSSDSSVWSKLGDPCIDQLPAGLLPTGSKAGCITEDGVYDMMGNLHEWTSDPAGTFRGGYYVDTVINGNGCLYATTAHDVYQWDYSTGFRCCADL